MINSTGTHYPNANQEFKTPPPSPGKKKPTDIDYFSNSNSSSDVDTCINTSESTYLISDNLFLTPTQPILNCEQPKLNCITQSPAPRIFSDELNIVNHNSIRIDYLLKDGDIKITATYPSIRHSFDLEDVGEKKCKIHDLLISYGYSYNDLENNKIHYTISFSDPNLNTLKTNLKIKIKDIVKTKCNLNFFDL